MKPNGWIEAFRHLSLVSGIGLTLSAAVWLGWLLGTGLERLMGGIGWVLIGLLIGIAGGFSAVYTMLKKFLL